MYPNGDEETSYTSKLDDAYLTDPYGFFIDYEEEKESRKK